MWWALGITAAVAGSLYAFSGKKPSKTLKLATIIKDEAEISFLIEKIAKNDRKWRNEITFSQKLSYLKEIRENLNFLVDEISAASEKVRGLQGTMGEGLGGVMSVSLTAGYLDGIIELYENLAKKGIPPSFVKQRIVKDSQVIQTAPRPNLWHKLTQPMKIELWSIPGKNVSQKKFPISEEEPETGVCAVLNPGNFEAPTDILHKLFLESRVVVAKSHPINATSWDLFMSKLFYPLVRDGYLGLTSGGPEVGGKILGDPNVTSWMMTGGCATFDTIVWGPAKDREENKKKNHRQITKKCHAELGAASPWIVVPGQWTKHEIETQVKTLLGAKTFNSGHVCASPQIIVVDKSWKLAGDFVEEILRQANSLNLDVKPYYYGTQDKLDSVTKSCPSAKTFPKSGLVFIPDLDAPGGGGNYLLGTEMFAPVFGIKYIDSNNVVDFLSKTSTMVNEKCFGSLSCTVNIDPRTRKILGPKFDEFLYDLSWGTIGVNVWAAFMAGIPYGTWGAPANRHTDTNIQSGIGKMGNVLLLENTNKSLVEGDWCDPILSGILQPPNSDNYAKRSRAYVNLAVQQTFGALFNVLYVFFVSK